MITNTIAELNDLYAERQRRALVNQRSGIVWVTQLGKVIAIEEMSDDHLNNTIKMLEHNKMRDEEKRREDFQKFIDNMTAEEREDFIKYVVL